MPNELPSAEFTAIYDPQDDGWIVASVAEVPGVHTQGRTMEEARANLAEALQLMLECNREQALAEAGRNARIERIQTTLANLP
jgi:predicted RNase H-like HicB family nuclease